MSAAEVRVYPYRWVVLGVFSLLNLTIQTLWIAYAPITDDAAKYYGTGELQIGWLAMSFMIAFVPLSMPASWAIDAFGFRRAVNVGAALMLVCGPLRGLAGRSYPMVLATTIGLAIAQPFLLNAWTKLPARWFRVSERATAVGIITLASLVGTAVGMALTPVLAASHSIAWVQSAYGAAAAVTALLFFAFARERPPTPPGAPGEEVRALMRDGLKHALGVRAFWLYLAVAFVGMGIFNGVSTWIEGIVRPRGFSSTQAGTLGAVMLLGGLLGAVVIPPLSDRQRKRQRYLLLGVALTIPGLAGLAFAKSFGLLLGSTFFMGFFLVSTLPVGMQYAAEITHPTPEGTSAGLIQLFGQGAVVFVYVMEAMRTADGAFTRSLVLAMALMAVCVGLVTRLRDARAD
ncbi:MAG TPA: MFS transporter [Polyangiaceae bacterium]|nr:MFS transporter [Polyangiaceae bacterium]